MSPLDTTICQGTVWVHRFAAALPPRPPGIAQNPLRHSAILRAPSKTLWRPRKTEEKNGASTQDWHGLAAQVHMNHYEPRMAGRKMGENVGKPCTTNDVPVQLIIQATWLSSAQGMNRWREASGDRVLHELVPRIPRVAS